MDWVEYEVRAYQTVLGRGALTAAEVAVLATIPEGRVHAILNRLQSIGALQRTGGHGSKWIAVPPDVLLADHLASIAERVEKAKAEAMAVYELGLEARERAEPHAAMQHGTKELIQALQRLVDQAQRGIVLVANPHMINRSIYRKLRAACSRGVDVEVTAGPDDDDVLQDLVHAGASCKSVATAPAITLATFDAATAVVAFHSPDSVMVTQSKAFAEMVERQMADLMQGGKPVHVVSLAP